MEPSSSESDAGHFLFFPSRKIFLFACVVALLIIGVFYNAYIATPNDFPHTATITIAKGATLSGETDSLYQMHIIKSEFAFKAFLVLFNGTHGLIAGDYQFAQSHNVIGIAWRVAHGIYGFKQVTLTVPEGTNIFELSNIVAKDFPDITTPAFLSAAKPDDGYLFPDTYFLSENATTSDIVSIMRDNFAQKIVPLEGAMAAFGKSEHDIIIMASILEKEAVTDTDRQTIAGILWKRLSKNMPLEVDAAFAYVPGVKDISNLSSTDLSIDSSYNTYLHTGLPPTPISNPGIDSIEDAMHPIDTPYYYYVSDKDGMMHYAVTLEDQDANIAKYLGQ